LSSARPSPSRFDLTAPTVAFIAASGLLWIAAATHHTDFWQPGSWARADSGQYLAVATHGYHLFRCPPAYPPHSWCGDSGWFPAYPGVLAALFALGLPHIGTAVLVSWLFAFATVLLVWHAFLRSLPRPLAWTGVSFVALAPSAVYMRAIFPLSMTVFFVVLALALLTAGRPWWASLAGAVAAAGYPTAVLLAPVLAIWVAWRSRARSSIGRLVHGAIGGAIVLCGVVVTFAIMRAQTGSWTAFFKTQTKYHHGFHSPLSIVHSNLHRAFGGPLDLLAVPAFEALFMSVVVLLVLAFYLLRRRGGGSGRVELVVLSAVIVLWLVPRTQSNEDFFRTDALLAPIALLVARLPRQLGIAVVAGAGALAFFLGAGFFAGRYV